MKTRKMYRSICLHFFHTVIWQRRKIPIITGYEIDRAKIASKHTLNQPMLLIEEDSTNYIKTGTLVERRKINMRKL